MSIALIVTVILNLLLGVAAGLGVASYFMQRKLVKELWQIKADIDNMYIGHGLKPPALERYLAEHPEVAQAWEPKSPFGPPEEQIP